jgi:hypothetical protein
MLPPVFRLGEKERQGLGLAWNKTWQNNALMVRGDTEKTYKGITVKSSKHWSRGYWRKSWPKPG